MLSNLLFLGLPGGGEWVILILAIVLLFGARKIPELFRGLGRGIREFKEAKNDIVSEIEKGEKEGDSKSDKK